MKRPGDEPSSSLQPANKLAKKSVTFLLPPNSSSSSSQLSPSPSLLTSASSFCRRQERQSPPSSASISSTASAASASNSYCAIGSSQNHNMTGSNNNNSNHSQMQAVRPSHPQRSQSAGDYSTESNLSGLTTGSATGGRRRSILRSTSASSSAAYSGATNQNQQQMNQQQPSPRFTFDFVDDASLSTSTSTRRSGGYSTSANYYGSSPTNNRSRGNKLSPSRLDARYSSRLPPSYSPSNVNAAAGHHVRNYTSPDIKRNLFGEDTNSNNGSAMAMDESSDFTEDVSMKSASNSNHGTPGSQQRRDGYKRSASSPSASPGTWKSPTNRSSRNGGLSIHTSNTATSNARSVSTFMSHSPRRQGMITGVTSPLSGNLGHVSVCSSAASSPCNSSVGLGNTSMSVAGQNVSVDHYERGGAGDRFIPSRALSNFNFELATGTGSPVRHAVGGGGAGHRRANSGQAAAAGTPSGAGMEDAVDLNPAPSFGATMMGGGTIVNDPSPTGTGTGAAGTGTAGTAGPDIAPTFSDDGASADGASERHDASNRQPLLYDALLRSELLGENIDPANMHSMHSSTGLVHTGSNSAGGNRGNPNVVTPFRERSNNLRFSPSNGTRQFYQSSLYTQTSSAIVNSFQLSPVSTNPSQRTNLGSYTDRCKRKIAKVPTKVLDAPALQDDFYLNLVDWSSQNVLAVGLGSCVYLWSAATSRVTQLCDLSATEDAVTSVAWSEGGRHLAIGSTGGDVQLWDASAQKLIRTMTGHSARVGALSWKLSGGGGGGGSGLSSSSSLLASGSRDRLIHLRDPRSDSPYEMRLCGHKQEVCGLRWSFDERSMLASGGNDNKLLVWDVKKHTQPLHAFADHTAAVKAIAWSPHQHGLLASGGGTADRCIRFWNCLTGHGINCIDTGSQVCNLAFSKNCNELVSTHGYSLNQIVVWKYPSMQKIATLTGHTYRVLYLALSPDGSTIVTGAGDETLRFWQVFPGPQKENKAGGLLFPAGMPGSVIR